jgi:hypothetical protein
MESIHSLARDDSFEYDIYIYVYVRSQRVRTRGFYRPPHLCILRSLGTALPPQRFYITLSLSLRFLFSSRGSYCPPGMRFPCALGIASCRLPIYLDVISDPALLRRALPGR